MILAAGLSPAWQHILVFDQFTRGEVNRAVESCACASGKVINVGVALKSLETDSKTLSVLGGHSGALVEAELARLGVPSHWVPDPANTRTCTTIIERSTGETTELVENATKIAANTYQSFIQALQDAATTAEWVILSGSLPPIEGRTSNRELYREMLELIRQRTAGPSKPTGARVILDARGPEMVECLSAQPFLVKPNREELTATVGRELHDETALIAAMREINSRGAQWILVTHGGGDVWLSSASELWKFTPPSIEIVNAIGCGDCLTAGLTAALANGQDLPAAVCFGIAAAGENAKQLLPSRLNSEKVRTLASSVIVTRVA